MNKKQLYESIMKKVSKNVKTLLETIDIPENDQDAIEYEVDDAIQMCLTDLKETGGAYLDWGVTGEMYKNVNSKRIAEIVAGRFQEKGYYVYYQGMGKGSNRIAPGTPVAIRIRKRPISLSEFDSEF